MAQYNIMKLVILFNLNYISNSNEHIKLDMVQIVREKKEKTINKEIKDHNEDIKIAKNIES